MQSTFRERDDGEINHFNHSRRDAVWIWHIVVVVVYVMWRNETAAEFCDKLQLMVIRCFVQTPMAMCH
jgi:hypothetical protein